MGLRVTFTRADGATVMIELDVAGGVAVGDVARDLHARDPGRARGDEAREAGDDVPAELTLAVIARSAGGRDPRALDPRTGFDSAGVCCGDHVAVVSAAQAPQPQDPILEAIATVMSGPDIGRSFALNAGVNDIGRDSDVAVLLSDPLVSKRHARLVIGEDIEVVDLGSTNGVAVGEQFVTRCRLSARETVRVGATELALARVARSAVGLPTGPTVSFTRSPRIVPALDEVSVDLPVPPARPQPRQFPRMALLAPVILGLSMFVITGRLVSLVFVAMAPLMMVGSYVDNRVSTARRLKEQTAEFRRALDLAELTLAERHASERRIRFARSPSVGDVAEAVRDRGGVLWTRRPEHDGFLTARLGLGRVPAAATAAMPSLRDTAPGLWEDATRVHERFATMDGVPVIADLRSSGAVGIAGSGERADAVARAMLVQIAGLHSPTECVIAGLIGPGASHAWRWLEWLPHTFSQASPLTGDHVVQTRAGADALLAQLEALVAHRAGQDIERVAPVPRGTEREGAAPEVPSVPAVVVLVCDDGPGDRARLIRLAEKGADVNVHLIWAAPSLSQVPAACRTVVTASDDASSVAHVRLGATSAPVACDTISVEDATDVARRLCCVEDAGAVSDTDAVVPTSVSYLDLHGPEARDPAFHAASWAANDAAPREASRGAGSGRSMSLRALVGHAGSAPAYLDLVGQGPHALVGGTTGAGKSEFLQSWILAMASAHSPMRVTFLLVDYKGGSAFADCVRLPHTVGLVTDLTPRLVERALTSLRAETLVRERLLAAKGAKDLEALIQAGDPDAPPSLVIVIDEFAALAQEVPAFVDGVVDIAQRGRSLGLHLIMATQRPAGVIKDSLRANTNLRIALRMADEPDSTDVLGAPGAAHIDPAVPGRVMVRTGPGRISTFQAAYAGGRGAPRSSSVAVGVRELDLGAGQVWMSPRRATPPVSIDTDAAGIVSGLIEASRRLALPPPRRPWLDELGPAYDLAKVAADAPDRTAFGLEDDPERQAQRPATVDFDTAGTVLVLGGSGAGKSTALRSIALGQAVSPGCPPVHVYGIDAGGGGLDALRKLPHVADVVDIEDQERIGRMLRRLAGMVDERVREFARTRASTLDEFRAASPGSPLPRVLLLIDGFGTFQAAYHHDVGRQEIFRQLVAIMTEGRAVGVHVAIAADRLGALHASVQSLVGRTLVLRLNDDAQYGLVGLRGSTLTPAAPPGRGIDARTRREFQVAVIGGNPSPQAQAEDQLAVQVAAQDGWHASPVPRLPTVVAGSTLPRDVEGSPVLGIDADSLEPRAFDVQRPIAIAGQAGSGRSTALAWMATAIRRAYPTRTLVLLTQRPTRIGALPVWDASHTGPAAGDALLQTWGERLGQPAEGDEQIVLCIESVQDFGAAMADASLVAAVKGARRHGHLIIGEADVQGWASGPLTSEIRGARRGLLLAPEGADCQLIFGVQAPRPVRAEMTPGRGVWVESGRVAGVQMPWLDGELSTDVTGGLRAPMSSR